MHTRKAGANKKSSCGGFKVLKICVLLAVGIWLVQYRVNKQRPQASTDELETDGGTVILKLGRRDLPYAQQGSNIITTDHQEQVRGADQVEEPKGHQLEGSYFSAFIASSKSDDTTVEQEAHLHTPTSNQTDHVTLSPSSYTYEGSLSNAAESLNESSNRSVAESGTEASNAETVEASSGGTRADNLQDSVVTQVSNSDDETRVLSPAFGGGGSFNNNDPSSVTEKTDMSTDKLSSTFGEARSFNNSDQSAVTKRTDMSTHRLSSTFGGYESPNNNDSSSAVTDRTDMSTNRLSSTIGGYESPNNNDLSAITERTDMSTDHNLNSTLAEPRPEEDDKIDDTATISRSSPYITRMQYSTEM